MHDHYNYILFAIIRDNIFNRKSLDNCVREIRFTIWRSEYSYLRSIRWRDFIENPETCINAAYERQKHIEDYDIHIEVM